MNNDGKEHNAHDSHPSITRLSGEDATYETFFQKHLVRNQPCLLSPSLVADWNALDEWTDSTTRQKIDEAGFLDDEVNGQSQAISPCFSILASLYRDHSVPVVVRSCNEGNDEMHEEEDRFQMSIAEAIEEMKEAKKMGDRSVYIKDWHLIRTERQKGPSGIREPYVVPFVFADDCECLHTRTSSMRERFLDR
jgi:uncharacterized protein (UPF0147 family)